MNKYISDKYINIYDKIAALKMKAVARKSAVVEELDGNDVVVVSKGTDKYYTDVEKINGPTLPTVVTAYSVFANATSFAIIVSGGNYSKLEYSIAENTYSTDNWTINPVVSFTDNGSIRHYKLKLRVTKNNIKVVSENPIDVTVTPAIFQSGFGSELSNSDKYIGTATITIKKGTVVPNNTVVEYKYGSDDWTVLSENVTKTIESSTSNYTTSKQVQIRFTKPSGTDYPSVNTISNTHNITLNKSKTYYGTYTEVSDNSAIIILNLVNGSSSPLKSESLQVNTLYTLATSQVDAYVYILTRTQITDVTKIKHKASDLFGAGFSYIGTSNGYYIYRSTNKWKASAIDSIIITS